MVNKSLTTPPDSREFEVSLFGPGYGESIVIHLGANNWMVVDSCLTPDRQPAALSYLERIGVDATESVKVVVASHWHDDHIRGLSRLYRACTSAQIVMSAALQPEEFLTVVRARKHGSMMDSSGVDELNAIWDELEQRSQSSGIASKQYRWALANRPMWQRVLKNTSDIPCCVTALSPSDAALYMAYNQIAAYLPKKLAPILRMPAPSPNHAAVALWVECGNLRALLGADLEETTEPGTGWSVIVDSTCKPAGQAFVLKVPHHGSTNGHQPRVWDEMLETQPVAMLTPFRRGNVVLPKKGDVTRICGATSAAYSTADTRVKSSKGRPASVEKTIRDTVRAISPVPMCQGQIRVRRRVDDQEPCRVELFGSALHLSSLAT